MSSVPARLPGRKLTAVERLQQARGIVPVAERVESADAFPVFNPDSEEVGFVPAAADVVPEPPGKLLDCLRFARCTMQSSYILTCVDTPAPHASCAEELCDMHRGAV